jgi:hypothetical protein
MEEIISIRFSAPAFCAFMISFLVNTLCLYVFGGRDCMTTRGVVNFVRKYLRFVSFLLLSLCHDSDTLKIYFPLGPGICKFCYSIGFLFPLGQRQC